MRLVDANAVESRMHELYVQPDIRLWQVLNVIAHTPTINAVEVVRCKDCKWYDSAFYVCSKCGVCVDRDFFCADGERMKEGMKNETN